jgi:AcrR family transcriptional regulator
MSRKPRLTPGPVDRRVQRTRDRLGDALLALVEERPFETITVQDVLDRAGVARSTFYVHYRDKNDLFLSDVDEFLEAMATMLVRQKETSDRVAPVREFFAHVAEMRTLYEAFLASGRIQDFLELAQGHFAAAIGQRLAGHPRARGLSAAHRAGAAQALAGALLALMRWWLDRGAPGSAAEMDELYHDIARGAVLGSRGPAIRDDPTSDQ